MDSLSVGRGASAPFVFGSSGIGLVLYVLRGIARVDAVDCLHVGIPLAPRGDPAVVDRRLVGRHDGDVRRRKIRAGLKAGVWGSPLGRDQNAVTKQVSQLTTTANVPAGTVTAAFSSQVFHE